MKWINRVILANVSPDFLEVAVAEFLDHDAELRSALVGYFGSDNAVDSDLNVVKRLSMHVDLDGREILVAVDGGGVRRALCRSR